VQAELAAARTRESEGDPVAGFRHLERAHVLGQASTRQHVYVHWQMLRWAMRQWRPSEIAAQAFRIIGAAAVTGIGLVPEGNTGGGNISAFRRLPVSPELAEIIRSVRLASTTTTPGPRAPLSIDPSIQATTSRETHTGERP
jgi:hypothetical protein